jgi:predicted Rdx family selenoprotein
VRGDDGVFDVSADGERIFSKDEAGRFPTAHEIVAALRERVQRR